MGCAFEGEGAAAEALTQFLTPLRLRYEVSELGVILIPERGYVPQGAEITEDVETRLNNRTVSLSRPFPRHADQCNENVMKVKYAVLEICKQADVEFDPYLSLLVAGNAMDMNVIPNIHEQSAAEALDSVLRQRNLRWKVRAGRVVIVRAFP